MYFLVPLIPKYVVRQLDWEVIIVDDASPDGTQEIAKQLAKVYGEDKIVRLYSFCYGTVVDIKNIGP